MILKMKYHSLNPSYCLLFQHRIDREGSPCVMVVLHGFRTMSFLIEVQECSNGEDDEHDG